MIEQAKFTYSPLGKAFEKQRSGKINQISAIKDSGKQIIESKEGAKNDFDIDRSGVSHEKQKKIFNRLVKQRALEFSDIKNKIDLNDLVYILKLLQMN